MLDVPISIREAHAEDVAALRRDSASISLREVVRVLVRRRRVAWIVLGSLLGLCLLYCLIAPNEYEAVAKVAMRTTPAAPLTIDAAESVASASMLSAPLQLETLANEFRSDRLAWRVILEQKLYQDPAFNWGFQARFPSFNPQLPAPDAQAYLLERFARRLHVDTMPRTLMIEIRFRSRGAEVSAAVVNGLIRAYGEQESDARAQATRQASAWLESQLLDLKGRMAQDGARLAAFQNEHGVMSSPGGAANGQQTESQHSPELIEVDELGRQLVAATTDRIVREAEFRAASQGDPELVVASDPRLKEEGGGLETALLEQLKTRQSQLEQEQAQLSSEHGPNFPRVVEIQQQVKDIDVQKRAEDAQLVESFRTRWRTARDREEMVRKSLMESTRGGLRSSQAANEYEAMRREADSNREVYVRVMEKVEQAGMSAGIHASSIVVIDPARQPVKAVSPDLPVYMAIMLFVGMWAALLAALGVESFHRSAKSAAAVLFLCMIARGVLSAQPQAPTPNPSGLPMGVAHLPAPSQPSASPSPQGAPAVWNGSGSGAATGVPVQAVPLSGLPMAAPIAPGDALEVSEFHTPEFHVQVRVSPAGTVTLPMVEEVAVLGLDERGAGRAIERALIAKGMLLHPEVSVLVTGYAGQDVSVLGEVTRPGVYPYTIHHRLLDLLSAASGLSPSAGRLVNVYHRSDPGTAIPMVLDPGGTDTSSDHNPELAPGDTVQVSRAGLVYVIGDVVRPGGFAVDPAQGLTVVQALSLAWGPTLNAASGKALLIREEKGGRTLTSLNLRRMMHGQDPDQPIHDRDILFVPDSTAKNLMNKTLESTIQSAIGLTIYAGLVYSQRF